MAANERDVNVRKTEYLGDSETSTYGNTTYTTIEYRETAHFFDDENILAALEKNPLPLPFLSFDVSCCTYRNACETHTQQGAPDDYNNEGSKRENTYFISAEYNDSQLAHSEFKKSLEEYWTNFEKEAAKNWGEFKKNFEDHFQGKKNSISPRVQKYSPAQTEQILEFLSERFNNGDETVKSSVRNCHLILRSVLNYTDHAFKELIYPEHKELIDLNLLIMKTIKENCLPKDRDIPYLFSGETCTIFRNTDPLVDNDERLKSNYGFSREEVRTSKTLAQVFQQLRGVDGISYCLENYSNISQDKYQATLLRIGNLLVAGIENSDKLNAERNFEPVYRTLLTEVNGRLQKLGKETIREPEVKQNQVKAVLGTLSAFFQGSSSSNSDCSASADPGPSSSKLN